MGILNTTPDSFSDGGCFLSLESALCQAAKLVEEGADIIDIGGESTRPGATPTSLEEEHARTIPVMEALRTRYPQLRLSIDTRHPSIAEAALAAGADIVNDVSGLCDPKMRQICAKSGCGIILMHMRGEPKTMQQSPHYQDVVAELRSFFKQRIGKAVEAGITLSQICIDPGIGFGKSLEHNIAILRKLGQIRPTGDEYQGIPIMMALSRKRFMGEILQDPEAGRGTIPTLTMSLLSAERGAELHRVHEVAPLKMALRLREGII